jgi:hypothetical protein
MWRAASLRGRVRKNCAVDLAPQRGDGIAPCLLRSAHLASVRSFADTGVLNDAIIKEATGDKAPWMKTLPASGIKQK